MDIILGFGICFVMLLVSALKGVYLAYPLSICYFIFFLIAKRKGFDTKKLISISITAMKRSTIILQIFILIGCIMSIWIVSGTLPSIISYCLSYLQPNLFILLTFIMTCLVSFFIGSSFGTVSTMGVALITLAKGGGVPLPIVTGAIMSGIYFGDRCSFVSSSAAVVASMCEVSHDTNVRNMLRAAILPFFASCGFYLIFSLMYPLEIAGTQLPAALNSSFYIGPVLLIPAIAMFLLPALKVNVKVSMGISIALSFLLAILYQDASPWFMIKSMLIGISYSEGPLAGILSAGGVYSMVTTYFCLMITFALAELFEQIQAFEPIKAWIKEHCNSERARFGFATLIGTLGTAFGCNQTMAIIANHDIMKNSYPDTETGHCQQALDISSTSVLIAGFVPWSIACFVPLAMLGVPNGTFLPFAFYLYGTPLLTWLLFPWIGKVK